MDPSPRLTTLLQLWKLLCNQGVAVCLPSRRLGRLGWRRFQCEGIMKIRLGAKGCLESQPHLFFVHDAFASEVYQINRQVPMLCSRRNHWISSVLIPVGNQSVGCVSVTFRGEIQLESKETLKIVHRVRFEGGGRPSSWATSQSAGGRIILCNNCKGISSRWITGGLPWIQGMD